MRALRAMENDFMKYYAGIDLGGTNIVAGIVDESYNIVAKASVKTNSPRPAQEIMLDMAKACREACENAGIQISDLQWVGVGSPGTANSDTGVIEYSNNIQFYDVPMATFLQEQLKTTVYIDNDANAAAYGEYMAGAAKGAKNAVMVTLGTGVGGGIIVDGKILRGANFAGAELGHIVIEVDGRQCTCARKGCFETYSSATGLIKTTKEEMQKNKLSIMWQMVDGDINKVSGRTAFDAMRKGDKSAKAAVDLYIKFLAAGITNTINIFQPDILCLGGGISKEGDYLINPLKEIVSREVYSRNSKKNAKIVTAALLNDAGIIGAALLGYN